MKMNEFLKKLFSDWPNKLFCLLLAILVVFVIRFSSYSQIQVDLPLEVRIPAGYTALNKYDGQITLNITGDAKVIHLISPDQVSAVADFTVISREILDKAVEDGTPLSVPVSLIYDEGIMDLSNEISLVSDPSQVKLLFNKAK